MSSHDTLQRAQFFVKKVGPVPSKNNQTPDKNEITDITTVGNTTVERYCSKHGAQ